MTAIAPPPLLDPGITLADFLIGRPLGVGNFGAVYEATWIPYQRPVALKVLHRHYTRDREALARFRREADTTASLHHPNVVSILAIGDVDGQPFIAMELLDGETLSALLKRDGALPFQRCLELLFPVIDAVAVMHQSGVVHRDIKPANIFLSADTQRRICPKLLDFGLAKGTAVEPQQPGITQSQVILGTPYYMSPEQVQSSRTAGPSTDQFSLAIILYECATGSRPFEGASQFEVLQRTMFGSFQAPSTLQPTLPGGFDAVIQKALKLDPSLRFGSLRAFGAALLPLADPATRARWSGAFMGMSHDASAAAPVEGVELRALCQQMVGERAIRRRHDRRESALLVMTWCAMLLTGVVGFKRLVAASVHPTAVASRVATRPHAPPPPVLRAAAPALAVIDSPVPPPTALAAAPLENSSEQTVVEASVVEARRPAARRQHHPAGRTHAPSRPRVRRRPSQASPGVEDAPNL